MARATEPLALCKALASSLDSPSEAHQAVPNLFRPNHVHPTAISMCAQESTGNARFRHLPSATAVTQGALRNRFAIRLGLEAAADAHRNAWRRSVTSSEIARAAGGTAAVMARDPNAHRELVDAFLILTEALAEVRSPPKSSSRPELSDWPRSN
jgi:hypothetical protein